MSTLEKRVENLEKKLRLDEDQQPITLVIYTCYDDDLSEDEVDAAVAEWKEKHQDWNLASPGGVAFVTVRRGEDGIARARR